MIACVISRSSFISFLITCLEIFIERIPMIFVVYRTFVLAGCISIANKIIIILLLYSAIFDRDSLNILCFWLNPIPAGQSVNRQIFFSGRLCFAFALLKYCFIQNKSHSLRLKTTFDSSFDCICDLTEYAVFRFLFRDVSKGWKIVSR